MRTRPEPRRRRHSTRSTGRTPQTLLLAAGLPFLAIAVARADTTVIGSALQQSTQASTMSQSANNHVHPLPVVGQNHSRATQTGVSALSDSQAIPLGDGGLLDGSANQGNTQVAATTQLNVGSRTETSTAIGLLGNDQLIGAGGIILGDTGQTNRQGNATGQTLTGSKVATALVVSDLGNEQILGDGDGVIVGSPTQSNLQADATAQSVTQKASNPTIGNSTLSATSITVATLENAQGIAAGTVIGSTGQANTQTHEGTQKTSQTAAPVITGSFIPKSSELSAISAENCQTVSDGSASCMLLP